MRIDLPDSPFTECGFTMQGPPPLEYGLELLDWMAEHGLNRLELRITGSGLWMEIPGYPELTDVRQRERLVRYRAAVSHIRRLAEHGRSIGVRVVPAIGHADGLLTFATVHPEWRVGGRIMHPTGVDLNHKNFCFRHPGVRKVYHAMVEAVCELIEPDEIQFWVTENRVHCECPRCREACPGGDVFDLANDRFMLETGLFYECVSAVRKARPGLGLSIWTSQGSRPNNDNMIRALPADVLWFYYDGERRGCYNLRHRRMIPPEVGRLAGEGFRIGVQLDWSSCAMFLTPVGTIREACAEAAELGLYAVCGWTENLPLNKDAGSGGGSPVFEYAAAMCRRPVSADDGDSLASVMASAALRAGHSDRIATAAGESWRLLDHWGREIYLADKYSFWWHSNNVPGAICERIARRAPVDEIDQRWTDAAWDDTVSALDEAMRALSDRAVFLRAIPDVSGYLGALADQMDLAVTWARCCRAVYWAGIVYHRMGSWDTVHGPWRDDQSELRTALETAETARARFEERLEQDSRLIMRIGWFEGRMSVLKDQIARALAAVDAGARPAPLPRQDAYPYLPPPDAVGAG